MFVFNGAGDVGPRTFGMSGKHSTTELRPGPMFLLEFTLLRIHSDWEALVASHQCVASLGFALGPISILFTLFYFRVLWMENLESRLWSLRPCLGLLIKCIGSLSLSPCSLSWLWTPSNSPASVSPGLRLYIWVTTTSSLRLLSAYGKMRWGAM